MFDFDALLSLSIVAVGIAGWAAFVRLMSGREPVNLTALFGHPWELAWPRGVQEEEPTAWRFDPTGRRPFTIGSTPVRATPTASQAGADECACEDAAAA